MNLGGFTPNNNQKEILRAIQLHGGITDEMTNRHGWTRRGLPLEDLRQLIDYNIVNPQPLSQVPLRVVWRLTQDALNSNVVQKILSEASRLRLKEYAPGGLRLDLRREVLQDPRRLLPRVPPRR